MILIYYIIYIGSCNNCNVCIYIIITLVNGVLIAIVTFLLKYLGKKI